MVEMKSKKIKMRCFAKINLTLNITGKREDGYHLIDTVMQSVSLGDRVVIKRSEGISLKCSVPELSGEENLGFKAAKLFFATTKIKGGAEIYIKKKIPQAGGMGGGSADGAAVLLGLNKLYSAKLSNSALAEMAVSLGADVPFFLKGGTVRCTGIGEIMQPIKALPQCYIVIAKQGTKPSTGEMYRRLDQKPPLNIDVPSMVEAIEKGDLKGACSRLDNAFLSVWENEPLTCHLKELNPLGAGLSGSGPTCFAVFDRKSKALQCKRALKKQGIPAFLAVPCKKSVEFE